jgi:hypothetical protein
MSNTINVRRKKHLNTHTSEHHGGPETIELPAPPA